MFVTIIILKSYFTGFQVDKSRVNVHLIDIRKLGPWLSTDATTMFSLTPVVSHVLSLHKTKV